MFVPKEIFLVKGVGKERERLASFEMALRDAGIAEYNLVIGTRRIVKPTRIVTVVNATGLA